MKNFKKKMDKLYKILLGNLNLTPEQINFILENYKDPNYVLGFHNTILTNKDLFFKNGLYCQNKLFKNITNLSHTVYWSSSLLGPLIYPCGGEKNSNMCIILKLPAEVFAEDQNKRIGIFENTCNNCFAITPKYILSAFKDGKVFNNPNYDGNYRSKDAIAISDPVDQLLFDKKYKLSNIKYFEEYYYGKSNIFQKVKEKFLGFFNNKKHNTKLLPEAFSGNSNLDKSSHDDFVSSLRADQENCKTQTSSIIRQDIEKNVEHDSYEL